MRKLVNKPIGTVSIYLIEKATGRKSQEVPIEGVIFDQYGIEFEFEEDEDGDYTTLPYDDFLFFSEDYTVVVKVNGDELRYE